MCVLDRSHSNSFELAVGLPEEAADQTIDQIWLFVLHETSSTWEARADKREVGSQGSMLAITDHSVTNIEVLHRLAAVLIGLDKMSPACHQSGSEIIPPRCYVAWATTRSTAVVLLDPDEQGSRWTTFVR